MKLVSAVALALLVPLGFGACDDDDDGGDPIVPGTPTAEVDVALNRFTPMDIVVEPGTTVIWTNREDEDHTITSGEPGIPPEGGIFDAALEFNETFAHTFDEDDDGEEFPYFCRNHFDEGEVGSVTVRRGGTTPASRF